MEQSETNQPEGGKVLSPMVSQAPVQSGLVALGLVVKHHITAGVRSRGNPPPSQQPENSKRRKEVTEF